MFQRRIVIHLAFSLAVMALCGERAVGEDVSFRRDVMAALSKAGCNLGVCHGNANGKGGFRLSLRGEDPSSDHIALTRSAQGRRVAPNDPDASLLLAKPLLLVPHEGGRRFAAGSREHALLREWIAAGALDDGDSAARLVSLDVEPREAILSSRQMKEPLRVTAKFSDGSQRDVSRRACYESDGPQVRISTDGLVERPDGDRADAIVEATVIVRYLDRQVPVRLAFLPLRASIESRFPPPVNFVDRHVFARLNALRIEPSPPVDDSLFLRRASIDLLGVLPTSDEARKFVEDSRPDKQARLIDALLQRPEFADRQALFWSDLLRVEEKTLDRKGVQTFHVWIRAAISRGMPMDQFVREIVAARGSTYSNPPANYYRALRDPVSRAETTAQLFLGVRLQCAKCHNHPFDRWTQADYYGWASLFARVDYKILENRRRDKNDEHEFDGEQIVLMQPKSDVTNPRTGRPAPPRFLEGGEANPSEESSAVARRRKLRPGDDRVEQLADWLTRADNTRFAQTMVNRVWAQMMGRGIVEPVDDFRATNPPSNPELLEALAADFVASRYDLRRLVRTICVSATYQASSTPNETNADDERNFSRAVVRRLPAEVLLDAACQAAGGTVEFNGYPKGLRAGEIPGVLAVRLQDEPASAGDKFLRTFGKPPRLTSCDCERSGESTLSQTFQLVSGPLLNELLTARDNRFARLLESPDAETIDEIYWSSLTRPPSEEERSTVLQLLGTSRDRRRTLEDVVWALINSQEFLLRR